MENNQTQENLVKKVGKKGSFKTKLFLLLFVVAIGIVIYGYYWYKTTNDMRLQAEQVIEKAQSYDLLQSSIQDEQNRCKDFIAQKEGDFGSFEYCKKFINWANLVNQ